MRSANNNPELNDCKAAFRLDDQAWLSLHVPRFKEIHSHYEIYETFLFKVLKAFCGQTAPLAIVQTRAKGIPSFAEKILRKRDNYMNPAVPLPPDPLIRLTDLCGGRVIVQTAAQLRAIRQLIEQCFDIDWANSDDASTRLRPAEFGYRTINYIVMADQQKLRSAGFNITVPEELLGAVRLEPTEHSRLKAEIQLRTLLEHAHADICHDLTYKTEVKVPDRLHRSFSAVAALLETADQEYGRLVNAFNEFKSNYGAFHSRHQVENEIARLRTVLAVLPENVSQAVRIADLALSIGELEQVIEVLEPYQNYNHQGVQRTLGTALTTIHWDTPRNQKFVQGRDLLTAACDHEEKDAELFCSLAECWVHLDNAQRAQEYFRQALEVDASEPQSLCRYLEFQVMRSSSDTVVRMAEPMIRKAAERCLLHIEGRVNLPNAWGFLALCRLLTGEPFASLDALAHLIDICEKPDSAAAKRPCAAGRTLHRLLRTLTHLDCIREKLKGFDWFQRSLLLGLAVRLDDQEAMHELRSQASLDKNHPHLGANDRIVIFSGGCAPEMESYMPPFRDALYRGVEGQSCTIISGGTRMGVSGAAEAAAGRSAGRIRAIGYLPEPIYKTLTVTQAIGNYEQLFPSGGTDFTPLEPLQGWTDLLTAGINPANVKLIAYAPGSISKVECAIALALGARVGVVNNPDLPKERRFNDPAWNEHSNLLSLPLDAMTLHAFIRIDTGDIRLEERRRLEPAARQAHINYAQSATPKDPSLQTWEQLDEALKLSNYHQVAYWENTLADFGLEVRQLTEEDQNREPLDMDEAIGKEGILEMAEIEHGRWNVERLGYGWRYDREKDIRQRRSPYLVPWKAVPPDIQQYDIDAVRSLPKELRKAGLELVKKGSAEQ